MSDYKRGHRAECNLIRDPIDNYLEHKDEIDKVISAFTLQDAHSQVNQIFYVSSSYKNDIYFLTHCLYNAKTELYDRKLTDMRSRYDPTEAFITNDVRSYSNWYAIHLYKNCREYIKKKTHLQFDEWLWRKSVQQEHYRSAQGWINLCEQLIKDGHISEEMIDYCEPYHHR